jgi:hypothetical protein
MKRRATGRTLSDADAIEVAEIFHEVVGGSSRATHANTVIDILSSFSREDLVAIDAAYRGLDGATYPDLLSAVEAETDGEVRDALMLFSFG